MGPKIVFPVMTTMYVVPGSRSEIIALAVFVTYDLLKLLSGDETLTWNVISSPFQNFFEMGFQESLIAVVLVSGSFSKTTGPDGTIIWIIVKFEMTLHCGDTADGLQIKFLFWPFIFLNRSVSRDDNWVTEMDGKTFILFKKRKEFHNINFT